MVRGNIRVMSSVKSCTPFLLNVTLLGPGKARKFETLKDLGVFHFIAKKMPMTDYFSGNVQIFVFFLAPDQLRLEKERCGIYLTIWYDTADL